MFPILVLATDIEKAASRTLAKSPRMKLRVQPVVQTSEPKLPLDQSISVKEADEAEPHSFNETSSISLRFLVVDDSRTSRRVLRHMLEKQMSPAHFVDEAVDGTEAVNMLKESMQASLPYNGVFMDFLMPGYDGAEATKMMRSLGYQNEIIICTGFTDPDVDSLMANGVTAIIEKPLNLRQISKIVQGHSIESHSRCFQTIMKCSGVELRAKNISAKIASNLMLPNQSKETTESTQLSNQTIPNLAEKRHCLVVDDVSSNRKMIANILLRQGHTVVLAEDGIAALTAYDASLSSKRNFDFIFMDFVMPSGPYHCFILKRFVNR